jgi:glycopeptide antibiotics resistance protein
MKHEIRNVLEMTWPTLVIVVSIVVVLRLTYVFRGERKRFVLHEEIFDLLFLVYLIILWQLVTGQDLNVNGGTNFMPFREILRYDYGTLSFYKQVFGNILLFIPLGYFASSYCKIKNLGTITVVSLISSTVIEVVQHFIGRCFDIDDIILNVVGGIIGFLLYTALSAIKNHLPRFLQKDWIYNVISVILLILIVIYLIKIF